jgi:hypothetical protein
MIQHHLKKIASIHLVLLLLVQLLLLFVLVLQLLLLFLLLVLPYFSFAFVLSSHPASLIIVVMTLMHPGSIMVGWMIGSLVGCRWMVAWTVGILVGGSG